MADNQYVNKVDWNGGTLIDLTTDDVSRADVALGKTFHLPSGEQTTGTASGGGEYNVTSIIDSDDKQHLHIVDAGSTPVFGGFQLTIEWGAVTYPHDSYAKLLFADGSVIGLDYIIREPHAYNNVIAITFFSTKHDSYESGTDVWLTSGKLIANSNSDNRRMVMANANRYYFIGSGNDFDATFFLLEDTVLELLKFGQV